MAGLHKYNVGTQGFHNTEITTFICQKPQRGVIHEPTILQSSLPRTVCSIM
jgi:hypothetical protein